MYMNVCVRVYVFYIRHTQPGCDPVQLQITRKAHSTDPPSRVISSYSAYECKCASVCVFMYAFACSKGMKYLGKDLPEDRPPKRWCQLEDLPSEFVSIPRGPGSQISWPLMIVLETSNMTMRQILSLRPEPATQLAIAKLHPKEAVELASDIPQLDLTVLHFSSIFSILPNSSLLRRSFFVPILPTKMIA